METAAWTWGDVAAEYVEGLPLFAAVILGAFAFFFILDMLDRGWGEAWHELTSGVGGSICLVLLAAAVLILGGYLPGGCFTPAEDPYLVGSVVGYNGPMNELSVSLIDNRIGNPDGEISFSLVGGSKISGDGTYSIPLDRVSPGGYEVLLWDKDAMPLAVKPIKLERPLRGEIKGPDFVAKGE
jgi:hypothetical protein